MRSQAHGSPPGDQGDLFGAPATGPEGLRYEAEAISAGEEAELLAWMETLPFEPFRFHGYLGARRVVAFGHGYDYAKGRLTPADPPPEILRATREAVARRFGLDASDFVQVLVTEYAPGAGIGWHRDKPQFDKVIGVSLAAECNLRFRLRESATFRRKAQRLAPRSAYLLDGPARSQWEHSIAPQAALRYSLTFRSLRA